MEEASLVLNNKEKKNSAFFHKEVVWKLILYEYVYKTEFSHE